MECRIDVCPHVKALNDIRKEKSVIVEALLEYFKGKDSCTPEEIILWNKVVQVLRLRYDKEEV